MEYFIQQTLLFAIPLMIVALAGETCFAKIKNGGAPVRARPPKETLFVNTYWSNYDIAGRSLKGEKSTLRVL